MQDEVDSTLKRADSGLNEMYGQYVKNELFLLPKRYELKRLIGRGENSIVCAAVDNSTQEHVAIKKYIAIFPFEDANMKSPKQTFDTELMFKVLADLRTLIHVAGHPNVSTLKGTIQPLSYRRFQDVYIVTDLMDANLRDLLETSKQRLNDQHVQFIIYQILLALDYLHKCGIVHGRVTPENILVNSGCAIKLTGFENSQNINKANANDVVALGHVLGELLVGQYRDEEELNTILMTAPLNPQSVDLLRKMINTTSTISTTDALRHPYFDSLSKQAHNLLDYESKPFNFDFMKLTPEDVKWETYQTIRELNGKEALPTAVFASIHMDQTSENDLRQRINSVTSSIMTEDSCITPASVITPSGVYVPDEEINGGAHDDRINGVQDSSVETQTTPNFDSYEEIKAQEKPAEVIVEQVERPAIKPVKDPLHNPQFMNLLAEMQKKNFVKSNSSRSMVAKPKEVVQEEPVAEVAQEAIIEEEKIVEPAKVGEPVVEETIVVHEPVEAVKQVEIVPVREPVQVEEAVEEKPDTAKLVEEPMEQQVEKPATQETPIVAVTEPVVERPVNERKPSFKTSASLSSTSFMAELNRKLSVKPQPIRHSVVATPDEVKDERETIKSQMELSAEQRKMEMMQQEMEQHEKEQVTELAENEATPAVEETPIEAKPTPVATTNIEKKEKKKSKFALRWAKFKQLFKKKSKKPKTEKETHVSPGATTSVTN